jgi:hypothetical protein
LENQNVEFLWKNDILIDVIMECSICFDIDFSKKEVTTKCNHVFHQSCLCAWLLSQFKAAIIYSCPLCRSNLNEKQWLRHWFDLVTKFYDDDDDGFKELCLNLDSDFIRLDDYFILRQICLFGRLELLKFLFQHHFKFNVVDVRNANLLIHARVYPQMLLFLLENVEGFTQDEILEVIIWSTSFNFINVLQFTFQKFSISENHLNIVIQTAYNKGHFNKGSSHKKKMFNFLCLKGQQTFLKWICENHKVELLERMMKNGFVSKRDAITEIMKACEKENSFPIAKLLMTNQFKFNNCTFNFIFNRACEFGNINMVRFLMEKSKIEDRKFRFQFAVLIACRQGQSYFLDWLSRYNRLDFVEMDKSEAFLEACMFNQFNCVVIMSQFINIEFLPIAIQKCLENACFNVAHFLQTIKKNEW